ncbi:MAG: hypothetical protein LPJ89_02605, partial [Hymenobacteraceae bacterium]|nr:hypothetical protein [Hymenobacteraceae bacterium]MDX5397973.1 hypothetical protein [Hymenobacteraceae bacterium]MDX5442656.1 hypothetical protein [Hymenobacteraceae bacterium]MDX5514045.1 hypothetical protein [Hymenobacteraceae bacterium]
QDTYRLTLTKFNNKPSLISKNQRAFSYQSSTFDQLMQGLSSQVLAYGKGFFKKSPTRNKGYEAAIAISQTPTLKEDSTKQYPQLFLSSEDMQRGDGGHQGNFYFRPEGKQQEVNAGFFGQRLRPYIEQSPGATRYLNRYRAAKWAFAADKAVLFGAIIGYGYEVSRDYKDYFNDRQKVYLGVAAASLVANHFITRKTNYNFRRAVDEYNVWATTQEGKAYNRLKPDEVHLFTVPVPMQNHAFAIGLTVIWQLD